MDLTCFALEKVPLPRHHGKMDESAPLFVLDCKVLEGGCPGALECPFYKTKDRLWLERCRAFDRIRSLTDEQQIAIAEKYYLGKMPWRGTETEGDDVQES